MDHEESWTIFSHFMAHFQSGSNPLSANGLPAERRKKYRTWIVNTPEGRDY